MVSHRQRDKARSRAGLCAWLTFSFMLIGCTHTLRIPDPKIAKPLIDPLPLTVAVCYSDKLQTWNEIQHVLGDTLVFPLGRPSVEWLSLALSANFERVVVFDHPPTAAEMERQGAIALLIVSPEELSFPFVHKSVSASYRIAMFDRDGKALADWNVKGQFNLDEYDAIRPASQTWGEVGRTTVDVWGVDGEHIGLAMRDAAAQIAVGLREEPAVRHWLEEHRYYRPLVGVSDRKQQTRFGGSGPVLLVSDDPDVLQCMRRALESRNPPVHVTSPWDLRDSLFPWFESERIAPQGAKTTALRLRTIAQSELGSTRLKNAALRYVIELSGSAEGTTGYGFVMPTPYGFYGVAWGTRKEQVTAGIGDLSALTLTDLNVKREGKYAVAAYVLPLPLIPATKTEACQALGSAIAERLQSVEQKPATQPPL